MTFVSTGKVAKAGLNEGISFGQNITVTNLIQDGYN